MRAVYEFQFNLESDFVICYTGLALEEYEWIIKMLGMKV